MDTVSILYEIESIDKELSRLRKKVRELNQRRKELLDQAVENMREAGEESITHRGKTYVLEERQRRGRKTDQKKKQDALLVLQDEGFHGEEAEEMYNKITGAMRGPETIVYTLKK